MKLKYSEPGKKYAIIVEFTYEMATVLQASQTPEETEGDKSNKRTNDTMHELYDCH